LRGREYDLDLAGAEREYKRALEINPNYAIAHNWYAIYLSARGRSDEAIAESRRALELDPLSANFSGNLAEHYFYARQIDQAVTQYQKTIAMNPKLANPHAGLARVYELQHKYKESLEELNRAIVLSKRSPKLIALLGHINAGPRVCLASFFERRYGPRCVTSQTVRSAVGPFDCLHFKDAVTTE